MDWSQLITTAVTALVALGAGVFTFKSAIMKYLKADNEFLTEAVKDLQIQRNEDRVLILEQGNKIVSVDLELSKAKKRISDLEQENQILSRENQELKNRLNK